MMDWVQSSPQAIIVRRLKKFAIADLGSPDVPMKLRNQVIGIVAVMRRTQRH
jgi:hypothetical protein